MTPVRTRRESVEEISSGFLAQLIRKGGGTLSGYARKSAAFWHHTITLAEDEVKHFKIFQEMEKNVEPEMVNTEVLSSARNVFQSLQQDRQGLDVAGEQVEAYEKAREVELHELHRERTRVSTLILVVLTPLVGTPMAHLKPPPTADVVDFFAHARQAMPDVPINLGCGRPMGETKVALDRAAG